MQSNHEFNFTLLIAAHRIMKSTLHCEFHNNVKKLRMFNFPKFKENKKPYNEQTHKSPPKVEI